MRDRKRPLLLSGKPSYQIIKHYWPIAQKVGTKSSGKALGPRRQIQTSGAIKSSGMSFQVGHHKFCIGHLYARPVMFRYLVVCALNGKLDSAGRLCSWLNGIFQVR